MDFTPVPSILLFDIEITEDLLQFSTEKQNKTTLKNRSTAPLHTEKEQVLETQSYNYTFPVLIFIWREDWVVISLFTQTLNKILRAEAEVGD